MNKRTFLSTLSSFCSKYDINRSDVIITGSGASMLLGLTDRAHDIDVYVTEPVWNTLSWNPYSPEIIVMQPCGNFPGCQVMNYINVNIHYSSHIFDYRTFKHRDFKVLSDFGLLLYRIDLGREKDWHDIKKLKRLWDELTEVDYERVISLETVYGKNIQSLLYSR